MSIRCVLFGAMVALWPAASASAMNITVTTLNVPQAANGTFAIGVSGSNVVGGYYDAGNQSCGFVFNGATYDELDYPGAVSTTVSGISDSNIV
ncbi:MAG TPA: hypothetical protein VGX76_21325, partial [Pirellulales bacterium]|nr:hypothetical protein [Pirellulales bacterium]